MWGKKKKKKTLKQKLKFVSTENLKILELLDCMNLVLHKISHGPIVIEKDPKKVAKISRGRKTL